MREVLFTVNPVSVIVWFAVACFVLGGMSGAFAKERPEKPKPGAWPNHHPGWDDEP